MDTQDSDVTTTVTASEKPKSKISPFIVGFILANAGLGMISFGSRNNIAATLVIGLIFLGVGAYRLYKTFSE